MTTSLSVQYYDAELEHEGCLRVLKYIYTGDFDSEHAQLMLIAFYFLCCAPRLSITWT